MMDEIPVDNALGKQWTTSQYAHPADGKAELDVELDQSFDDVDC